MKRLSIGFFLISLITVTAVAQGKYAGTKKSIIGKVFEDSRNLVALKGWKYMEGGLANSLDDPERITSDVFKKGTTYVVIFSIMEDTASGKFKVMDVVEITGAAKHRPKD